jgi:hypothetical protein
MTHGRYESYYLKVADPREPRGAWIRYTVLKRPGGPALGSVWCTLWSGEASPAARKVTLEPEALGADPGELIHVGASRLVDGHATGSLDDAAWEISYTDAAAEFAYLPRSWMYRAPVPRTKAVSVTPRAIFQGEVSVGGQRLAIDGWPGMVGHNWGAEHAERWIWLHGAGFPDAPEAWFDVIIGRIKVGGVTLPWIANGGLWLDGTLHRLGGLRPASVTEQPTRCQFDLPGRVHGELTAFEERVVAWQYSDPAGPGHFTTNCSVAALTLSLDGRSLHLPAGAAYELGTRERPGAIAVQPYPDP